MAWLINTEIQKCENIVPKWQRDIQKRKSAGILRFDQLHLWLPHYIPNFWLAPTVSPLLPPLPTTFFSHLKWFSAHTVLWFFTTKIKVNNSVRNQTQIHIHVWLTRNLTPASLAFISAIVNFNSCTSGGIPPGLHVRLQTKNRIMFYNFVHQNKVPKSQEQNMKKIGLQSTLMSIPKLCLSLNSSFATKNCGEIVQLC